MAQPACKAGETQWKIRTLPNWTWEMEYTSSECTMVTEVKRDESLIKYRQRGRGVRKGSSGERVEGAGELQAG